MPSPHVQIKEIFDRLDRAGVSAAEAAKALGIPVRVATRGLAKVRAARHGPNRVAGRVLMNRLLERGDVFASSDAATPGKMITSCRPVRPNRFDLLDRDQNE